MLVAAIEINLDKSGKFILAGVEFNNVTLKYNLFDLFQLKAEHISMLQFVFWI